MTHRGVTGGLRYVQHHTGHRTPRVGLEISASRRLRQKMQGPVSIVHLVLYQPDPTLELADLRTVQAQVLLIRASKNAEKNAKKSSSEGEEGCLSCTVVT